MGVSAARAGEIAEAGVLAESELDQHRYVEALTTLESAEDRVWQEAPLAFRKALFVSSRSQGFGLFDVHAGDMFKRVEPIIVYAEPVGYGFRKEGEFNVIDLSVDFEIKTGDGRPVGSQKNVASPVTCPGIFGPAIS